MNSTPPKRIESLMDFSTPMSTMNNSRIGQANGNILEKLFQKFHEHRTNFHQTQTYLNLLDNHLRELTNILHQIQNSLDHQSGLKSTTEHLETRVLQMSIKREQIRTVIHQSPVVNQTLNELIHQISPSKSQCTDSSITYSELINAVKLSFNQKNHLLERYHREENHLKDRTIRMQQRQQTLLLLIEKLLEQQKNNEANLDLINPSFESHEKHLRELNDLNEEYQDLQNENHRLKQMAKENIRKLHRFIEPNNV